MGITTYLRKATGHANRLIDRHGNFIDKSYGLASTREHAKLNEERKIVC